MLPFQAKWWRDPELLPLVKELEAWVDNRQASADHVWAVKDPRTTRFLPLWQEMLGTRGITPRYLLTVRDPAEVVASQVKRDSIPAEHLYRIWLRYNMEALLHAGADLAGVFLYSHWFSDGTAQLRRWLRSWVSNEQLMNATPFSAVCCRANCVGNRVAQSLRQVGHPIFTPGSKAYRISRI